MYEDPGNNIDSAIAALACKLYICFVTNFLCIPNKVSETTNIAIDFASMHTFFNRSLAIAVRKVPFSNFQAAITIVLSPSNLLLLPCFVQFHSTMLPFSI